MTARLGLAGGRVADPPDAQEPPDCSDASVMFAACLRQGTVDRPQYLWPMLLAARVARALGVPRISAVEFGVAGGNGLLAMEAIAAIAERRTEVTIDVYGFDTGAGMPAPGDHRDVPWAIRPGWFPMDEVALRARLTRAQLVLGPVSETVRSWLGAEPAPLGFASFDLDYYSSTLQAFGVLDASPGRLLPRVACYFDDVFGYGWSDFNGERAAIADFNRDHETRKIGKIHGLRFELPQSEASASWPEKIFLAHAFDHPLYNAWEGNPAPAWFEAMRLLDET